MTKSAETEPWRELPAAVATMIEPELPAISEEILATIAREVPEYARPLEGRFGRGIETGVTEALGQFVALIRDPDADRAPGREVYVALGRGELGQGRTLDSLQSAYRVGARVAWRRIAAVGRGAGLEAEVLSLLAESIFAYIDRLSADSVEGYAEAQSEREGERRRRRWALAELLLREPPAEEADLRVASRAARWPLPRQAAALACPEEELARLRRRLPAGALVASVEGTGCVIVPDPEGPGRPEELSRAADGSSAALGPAGGREGLAASWALARTALGAREAKTLAAEGLLRVDEHLGELLVAEGRAITERIGAHRLASLEELTEKARARMEETALAYLQRQGNAAAIARALHLHPQTVRHRLGRLRQLLGEQLDEPRARFELEAALRARAAGDGGG